MKKVLIGTFFTAALVIAGATNVNAQKITGKKSIKKEVTKEQVKVVAKDKKAIKAVNKDNIKNAPGKMKKDQIAAPKSNKTVTKEVAKQQIKRQPAKLNKKKK